MQGHMEHIPWAKVYKRMLSAASIDPPGYIIHESAYWSDIHKKWFFLPRRASKKRYVPMGTNIMCGFEEKHVENKPILDFL